MSESWSVRRIVVGTDYSESSRGAVGEALRLGKRFGAVVTVVHVALSDAAARDESAMASFLASEPRCEGVDVRPVIVRGTKVVAPLAEVAEREGAELLVVGPRARTFVERHITGSIAQQLFSQTPVSVLATPRVTAGYERVLVALDDSLASRRALEIGAALLEDESPQARLIALHVLAGRGVDALASVDESHAIESALIAEARAHLAPLLEVHASSVPVSQRELVVRVGALGQRVPQVVEETQPDLVCMGTVGRRGLLGLLAGNAAETVARQIDRPLLVAHP